jgi:DNA polymerase I
LKYFIIDGMNLAYRSHMILFESKTSEGAYSGMFFGFIRSIQSLKKRFRQYKFIVVWDHRPEHKYQILPSYKSGRTKLPSPVFKQIDSIKDMLANINVDQYDLVGQEADDVIATLSERFKNKEDTEDILIYTNDKDMLQLVEEGIITVFKPKVGIHPEKFYDEEAVKERFGVAPRDLAVYRSFEGDESDSIKGVPRVRRKIISSIVNQYKGINAIFESLGDIKLTDNERSRLVDFKDSAEINHQIIRLDRTLDGINEVRGGVDLDNARSFLNQFEIKVIKPETLVDLFSSSLNIRISESRPAVELESFSLFEE